MFNAFQKLKLTNLNGKHESKRRLYDLIVNFKSFQTQISLFRDYYFDILRCITTKSPKSVV